jgi:hypothetical protein
MSGVLEQLSWGTGREEITGRLTAVLPIWNLLGITSGLLVGFARQAEKVLLMALGPTLSSLGLESGTTCGRSSKGMAAVQELLFTWSASWGHLGGVLVALVDGHFSAGGLR